MKDALNMKTFLRELEKATPCSEKDAFHSDSKQMSMLLELITKKEIPTFTSNEILEMTHCVGALCGAMHVHMEKWTSEETDYGNMLLYPELRSIPSATKRRLF